MSSSYELHSFHMNIGLGDGSLHILVDTTAKTKTGSHGTIQATILIDSGNTKDGPVECIQRTMARIGKDYDLPKDDGTLHLDVVVVTHWDQDHYKTLVNLLQEDLAKSTTGRILFVRYDTNGDPTTTMYAPSWHDNKTADSKGNLGWRGPPEVLSLGAGRQHREDVYESEQSRQ